MLPMLMVLIRPLKPISLSFKNENVPVGVYAFVAGKSVQEMEKAAEVFL